MGNCLRLYGGGFFLTKTGTPVSVSLAQKIYKDLLSLNADSLINAVVLQQLSIKLRRWVHSFFPYFFKKII